MLANSGDPDQMLCFAASDLGLHCLPMSNKKYAIFIWDKSAQQGISINAL